jgi:hypothetical protein
VPLDDARRWENKHTSKVALKIYPTDSCSQVGRSSLAIGFFFWGSGAGVGVGGARVTFGDGVGIGLGVGLGGGGVEDSGVAGEEAAAWSLAMRLRRI